MSSYNNLFKSYFDNTGTKYQSTPIVCESAANNGKDLSFDINNSEGQITDNRNVISSIDLSDIHYPLSEYATQTKVLMPYTSYLLSGNVNGLAYATQYFKVCFEVERCGGWKGYVNTQFNLSHICNFRQTTTRFEIFREMGDTTSVIQIIQKLLDKQKLPIQVDVIKKQEPNGESHEFITFSSTQLGYEFIVSDLRLIPIYQDEDFPDSPFVTDEVKFTGEGDTDISDFFPDGEVDCEVINKIVNSIVNKTELDEDFEDQWRELIYFMSGYSPDVHKLFEIFPWRVYSQKYPNGAMGGLVMKVEYPKNVDSSVRALKVNHIKDCISVYNPVTLTEDASLVSDCEADMFDDWHTPTVHDRVLFQKFNYTVRASYINPEENDNHDWMDGGIYVHNEVSDNVEDDGWVSGTRALDIRGRNPYPTTCTRNYVSNKSYEHDEEDWCGESPMPFGDDLYWADGHVDTQDFIGMYGYLNHVHKTNEWINVGQFYSILGQQDSEDNNIRNLVPSAFIFNPNPYPVKINYMIFS